LSNFADRSFTVSALSQDDTAALSLLLHGNLKTVLILMPYGIDDTGNDKNLGGNEGFFMGIG
jgi:hypothetical protein